MATNRFLRQRTEFLRETAERRAQEWRNEVGEAGWAPCRSSPPLLVLAASKPEVHHSRGAPRRVAIRFCSDCDRLDAPMVTSG